MKKSFQINRNVQRYEVVDGTIAPFFLHTLLRPRTSMRSTRPVAVLSCPVVHDPTPWPKLRELDPARTGYAHLNNQVQPQRRGRVMLVPTKIDLTVDAERHKTFKVPPFLQALEHSSDCERSSQRVEKIFNFFNKKYGQGSNPLPPKRACPFLGKWRNLGTVPKARIEA